MNAPDINAGSDNMPLHQITVHKTYKENGEEGPQRSLVYVDDKLIQDHVINDPNHVHRIKKNCEAIFNRTFELIPP